MKKNRVISREYQTALRFFCDAYISMLSEFSGINWRLEADSSGKLNVCGCFDVSSQADEMRFSCAQRLMQLLPFAEVVSKFYAPSLVSPAFYVLRARFELSCFFVE